MIIVINDNVFIFLMNIFFVYVGVFYNWWCLNEIDRWRNLFVWLEWEMDYGFFLFLVEV